MNRRKKIVIIGATSAIAEHCARLWAIENPGEMVLVGRDLQKIAHVANDLQARTPSTLITTLETDFNDAEKIQTLVNEICSTKPVDIVLIAHGLYPDQQKCQNDLLQNQEVLKINGISPVLFAEAFISYMEKANQGTLAIIGSVAGDRGKKSNYIYGSAKGLVDRYCEGLQHRLVKTRVRVVLIKPGPTDTPMTASLKQKGAKLASVEKVAQCITNGMALGKAVIYAPRQWELIMLVIRLMPRFIFNKLNI